MSAKKKAGHVKTHTPPKQRARFPRIEAALAARPTAETAAQSPEAVVEAAAEATPAEAADGTTMPEPGPDEMAPAPPAEALAANVLMVADGLSAAAALTDATLTDAAPADDESLARAAVPEAVAEGPVTEGLAAKVVVVADGLSAAAAPPADDVAPADDEPVARTAWPEVMAQAPADEALTKIPADEATAQPPTAAGAAPAATAEVTTPDVGPPESADAAPAATGPGTEGHKPRAAKCRGSTAEIPAGQLSALDAAAQALAEAGRPMGCKAIIEAMAAQGYWTSPAGKTPDATLYSAITREINAKGQRARFVKAARGQFTLAAAV